MKFTPLEREIVTHRLEVPDCIAEVLEEDEDVVTDVCDKLIEVIKQPFRASTLTRLQQLVLIDAIDGSTYEALAEGAADNGQLTKVQLLAVRNSAANLQDNQLKELKGLIK